MTWTGEMTGHWAMPLIDRPWKFGAQGPDEFDCLGFASYVQRVHFGIELPYFEPPESWSVARQLIETEQQRDQWERVTRPADGDMALMARNKHPVHIGVVVKAGNVLGIIHCIQNVGVVFQNLQAIRASGWGGLTYYRHRTCAPTP